MTKQVNRLEQDRKGVFFWSNSVQSLPQSELPGTVHTSGRKVTLMQSLQLLAAKMHCSWVPTCDAVVTSRVATVASHSILTLCIEHQTLWETFLIRVTTGSQRKPSDALLWDLR